MAESLAETGDDSERNFILAKLVSLFGDTVDFDVINLVAQENEWNEEKCNELLKVLGDYKNPDTTPFTSDVIEILASDNQSEASPRFDVERVTQKRKGGYLAAASKSAKSKMAGHRSGHHQIGLTGARHHSPSQLVVQRPRERSAESQDHHDKVKALIESGTPVLIILRGLPGSGKTTLAKNLLSIKGAKGGCCHSTDNFFLVPRGGKGGAMEYQYDPLRLGEAHEWNRVQVLRAIAHGVTPIIVDNTNVQKWEMLPYVEMALEPWKAEKTLRKMASNGSIPKNNICSSLGPARMNWKGKKCRCGYTVMETSKVPYRVELLEPLTWWYQNPSRLAKVNQHGVSQKKITQMLSHFEFDVTGQSLVHHFLKRKSDIVTNPQGLNARPGGGTQPPPLRTLGQPLFNTTSNRYPGNELGARPRAPPPPSIPGNNVFRHNFVNHFQNPAEFSSGSHPQLLGFPFKPQPIGMEVNPFSMPSTSSNQLFATSQSIAAKYTMSKIRPPGEQPRKDDLPFPLSNRSVFSKSASNLSFPFKENQHSSSSGKEPDEKCKGMQSGSLNTSETNLYEKSIHSETSSFQESECVEMTEEELKEWMETNSSRWEWQSSDEDSEDECESKLNKPKQARAHRQRCRNSSSEKVLNEEEMDAKISANSAKSVDGEVEEENDKIPEWVTEEFDPLTSWNPPDSNSDDGKDSKVQVPLPPRNSKRKRLVENTSKLDEDFESLEKSCDDVDQVQIGIIQQIHTLLGELGVRNKELDSSIQIQDSSENDLKSTSNADNTDPVLNSEIPMASPSEPERSDAVESTTILESEEVNSYEKVLVPVKDIADEEAPLISFSDDSPEVETVTAEFYSSFISATETKASDTSENILKGVCANDMLIMEKKFDNPLLDAFNVILSHSSTDVEMEMGSSVNENADCKESFVPPSKENSTKNPAITSSENSQKNVAITTSVDTKGQSLGSKKHFDSLASVFNKGFGWFDTKFNVKPTDKIDQVEDPEKHDEDVNVQFLQQLTSNADGHKGSEVEIGKSLSSFSEGDPFKEALNASVGELLPAKLQTECMESRKSDFNIKSPERAQVAENDTGIDVCKSDYFIEFKDIGGKDNYSLSTTWSTDPMQQEKENELRTQTGQMVHKDSMISVSLEDGEEKSDKFVDTPAPSDASLVTAQNDLHKRSSCLENLQKSFKGIALDADSNILTPDTLVHGVPYKERNVDGNCVGNISDVNIVQPINSCRNVKIDAISNSQSLGEKKESATGDNPEETSEIEGQLAAGGKRSVTPQDYDEPLGMSSGSQQHLSSDKTDKENDLRTILGLPEQNSNEEMIKPSSTDVAVEDEEQEENEEFITYWSALAAGGGETMDSDDEKETFPLVLDSNFIEQICQKFGNPYQDSVDESSKCFSGQGNNQSGVTVHVPAYIARKLHEFWLETQWNAILDDEDTAQRMIQEDELLARQLQEFEREDLKDKKDQNDSTTPNLREIMDMERAMAIYKAEQDKETQLNQRSDMSTRLSWDLLTKEFTQVPQDIITQIFSAYNFSYNNTREALISSLPDYERETHEGAVKDVISPEALAAQEKALIEKAKLESLKFQNMELVEEEEAEKEVEGSWETLVDHARKSAALNHRLQKERHAQAQAASRSGIPSAAAYYCRMASLHKQKADEANRKAANILSRVFTGEYSNLKDCAIGNHVISRPPITLDMHSMSVLEALRVMNAFLDAHAEWLRNKKSGINAEINRRSSPVKMTTLFLITGRGVNSQGGIPRIKPAVEKQLEKRGVWYEELNPGLLRVMVSANLSPAKKM